MTMLQVCVFLLGAALAQAQRDPGPRSGGASSGGPLAGISTGELAMFTAGLGVFSEVDEKTAFKRVTSTWKKCAKAAEDRGLKVCWEFEPGFAFNKPSDIFRILDAVPNDNFGVLYDTCHAQMVAVIGARQNGKKETLAGGQLELISRLKGRINHLHLIDSDNTCHKDANGKDETSAHPPFGDGVLNFDGIIPALNKLRLPHDWWTIDLCFWADAWPVTKRCKEAIDKLNRKFNPPSKKPAAKARK